MAEKNVQARIQHKHDTEANWNKATGFIPKAGELIIYDKDENHNYLRVKIGDGSTLVSDLEFVVDTSPDFSTKPITATSTDGIAYTATVNGLTELYVGCSLMIVPNRESASASGVTLNVNNLGAVGIRRGDSLSTSEWWGFFFNAWMKAGYPVRLKYTGTYWIVEGATKPCATDLYGTVPVEKGGTGVPSHSDTTYIKARYRASALVSIETNPSTNGVINWTYE